MKSMTPHGITGLEGVKQSVAFHGQNHENIKSHLENVYGPT
jgi:hypothetical protein